MADGEKKAEEHNVRYIWYTVVTQKSDTQNSYDVIVFSTKLQLSYMETSAKTGYNVKKLFQQVARSLTSIKSIDKNTEEVLLIRQEDQPQNKSSSCSCWFWNKLLGFAKQDRSFLFFEIKNARLHFTTVISTRHFARAQLRKYFTFQQESLLFIFRKCVTWSKSRHLSKKKVTWRNLSEFPFFFSIFINSVKSYSSDTF